MPSCAMEGPWAKTRKPRCSWSSSVRCAVCERHLEQEYRTDDEQDDDRENREARVIRHQRHDPGEGWAEHGRSLAHQVVETEELTCLARRHEATEQRARE